MKTLLLMALLFISFIAFGQNKFDIDYPSRLDTVINVNDTVQNQPAFNIDFIDKYGRVIKNRERLVSEENVYDTKTYYFYKGSQCISELLFFFKKNTIFKTEYQYNKRGELSITTSYTYSKKIEGDTLSRFKDDDYYLNNPSQIPTMGWVVYNVEKKEYNNDGSISYKGFFSQQGKDKKIQPDREQYFIYDDKQQLIEHTSLSRRVEGGSNLMETFEYNCEGKMIKENDYEDGRYQSYKTVNYTDSLIYVDSYFFNSDSDNKEANPYSRDVDKSEYVYDLNTKKYYDKEHHIEFVICDEAK